MADDRIENGGPKIDRRGALECMIWAGTGVLWTLAAACRHRSADRRGASRRGRQRLHIPADHRQPCRLRQAGQPERARHAAGGHRQGEGDAAEARLHDPHRRHHASVEGRRNSTTPTQVIGDAGLRRALRARRARRHRRGRRQGLSRTLRQGHQGRRLVQLRPGRRPFHRPRQRGRSEGRRPRQSRRRAARLARGRPQGQSRPRRRSSSSPIFRCGPSTRSGAGAPRTAARRSRC